MTSPRGCSQVSRSASYVSCSRAAMYRSALISVDGLMDRVRSVLHSRARRPLCVDLLSGGHDGETIITFDSEYRQ